MRRKGRKEGIRRVRRRAKVERNRVQGGKGELGRKRDGE